MNPNNNNQTPRPRPAGELFRSTTDGVNQPVPAQNLAPPPPAAPAPPPPPSKFSKLLSSHNESLKSVLSTFVILLLAPVVALCIAAFVIQSYQVDGVSMQSTLQNDDRLIVNKLPRTLARITHHPYVPHRGDIIIFNQTGLADTPIGQSKQLIKRVVGLPGEHIVIQNGYITIYNAAHPKGFNPDTQGGYKNPNVTTAGQINEVIPAGEVFVCGDNRPDSEDSRYFGPIQVGNIVGKLELRILPLNSAERF